MMKNKRFFLFLALIFLAYSFLGFAVECTQDCSADDYIQSGQYDKINDYGQINDWSKVDYSKVDWNKITPSLYNNIPYKDSKLYAYPQFYEHSDPAKWNYAEVKWQNVKEYDKISWEKVDYRNPTLNVKDIPDKYADKIDVDKIIEAGKGKDLTAYQIETNLPNIKNLNDVDFEKANKAIKNKYGVEFIPTGEDGFGVGSVRINKDGILSTSSGSSMDLNGKLGVKIEISKEDGKIHITSGIEQSQISENDNFYFSGPSIINEDGDEIFVSKGEIKISSPSSFIIEGPEK
jgi:hypothetical protein